jgi:hypothetical protein
MILLFGIISDPVTAHLCTRLLARHVAFLLIDPRHCRRQLRLWWSIADGRVEGRLGYGRDEVELASVRSICVRWLEAIDPPSPSACEQAGPLRSDCRWYHALSAFTNAMPALVVNRPAAACSNGSKIYQQTIIRRHGFPVPRTLVTMVPEEVERFYEECGGRVIYKSISDQRSIVRRLHPEDFSRLGKVRRCATQFQEYLAGIDVRVHTVGDRVFAHEISSEAIDYRYSAREGTGRDIRSLDLPPEIAERCVRLAGDLGLSLSGIDLRRTPDGEFYCFEVNPVPGFTFYQDVTGQRIGDAVIDLLCRGLT